MRRRELLIGTLGVAAAAGLGGGLHYWQRRSSWRGSGGSVEHTEYEGPYARLGELPDNAKFDVCVVGSGPAGTFLAADLAARGVRTLLLEAGLPRRLMLQDARYARLNGFRSTGGVEYPLSMTHLIAPGGTSALWNGRCPRLTVGDFETNAYTPPASAWPISYADLEPFYARAEKSLRVRGDPQPAHHCPRSTPLQPPELPMPQYAQLRRVAEYAGLKNSEIILPPSSTSPNGPGPLRVARDALEQVADLPGVTLVLGATAHRLIDDATGRIVQLTARDIDGNEKRIRARGYVLAGGGVETARRLLLSRSERWPAGLGNRHGRVGRGFTDHSGHHFLGVLELPRDRRPAVQQRVRNFKFYEPLKSQGFGSMMLHMTLRPEDPAGVSRRHLFEMSAETELEITDSNCIALSGDPQAVDSFNDPWPEVKFDFTARDRALGDKVRDIVHGIYKAVRAREVHELPIRGWGHHHIGTVRMGTNPATSVVDADLRVHGLHNLFVATSGAFVTAGAVNPTLTIVALSHRLAAKLQQLLEGGDLPPVVST